MTQTYENYNSKYNKEIEREISNFMSKKRRQVVETLYDMKRLSQGELARALNTSAASLSNILLNFEMFTYQLLDSENEGKRRYYSLTDLGQKFVRSVYRNKQSVDDEHVIHEPFQDMQSITACLEAVKSKYDDDWEIALEDVLYTGIKYHEVLIDSDGKEIDAFLHSIERVLADGYEIYYVDIMELLYSNKILRRRLEQFLTIFEVFIPVLKAWRKKLDSLQMYNFLESIVTCDTSRAEQYILQLQWEDGQYDRLSEFMQEIIKCTEKKDESEIYRYFNLFLAGEDMLSAILAKEVYAACKTMKEKIQDEEKI